MLVMLPDSHPRLDLEFVVLDPEAVEQLEYPSGVIEPIRLEASDVKGGILRPPRRNSQLPLMPIPKRLVEGVGEFDVPIQEIRDLDEIRGSAVIQPPVVAALRAGIVLEAINGRRHLDGWAYQVDHGEAVTEITNGMIVEGLYE